MLKPKDIIVPEFSKMLAGGYKPSEVKQFIDMLLTDYEELYESYLKREEELKTTALELKKISEQYYELSKEREVELSPEKVGAEIVESAVRDAKEKSDEIYRVNVERTKKICNEIVTSYSEAFESEKEKFIALHVAYSEFISKVTEACKSQADAISSNTVKVDIDAVRALDFKSKFRAAVTASNNASSSNGEEE